MSVRDENERRRQRECVPVSSGVEDLFFCDLGTLGCTEAHDPAKAPPALFSDREIEEYLHQRNEDADADAVFAMCVLLVIIVVAAVAGFIAVVVGLASRP